MQDDALNERLVKTTDIARSVAATIYSVQKALDNLGIVGEKRSIDRRSLYYPFSAIEQVRQWLKDN